MPWLLVPLNAAEANRAVCTWMKEKKSRKGLAEFLEKKKTTGFEQCNKKIEQQSFSALLEWFRIRDLGPRPSTLDLRAWFI